MTEPEVSVIVPAHNVEGFLAGALDRLLHRQSHASFEIVVVDDASTDCSADIAHSYVESDPRVRLVRHDVNLGVAAARERGTREARGEFVWFVDADDDWPDDAVQALVDTARRTGADTVVAQALYGAFDGTTKPVGAEHRAAVFTGRDAFRAFLVGRITGHLWNKLFRRDLLNRIEFTRARQHSDQAMVAQLLAASEMVAVAESVVYRYILREGSIIRSGHTRAASLETVGSAVRDAAEALDPVLLRSQEYDYFRARFELLSRLKDAISGAYSDAESSRLLSAARRATTPRIIVALASRRDWRRFALLSAAKTAPALYRRVMKRVGPRE